MYLSTVADIGRARGSEISPPRRCRGAHIVRDHSREPDMNKKPIAKPPM